ncbi:MAG TPA: C45 family peptidase, partial [Dongiaceae bacterium]
MSYAAFPIVDISGAPFDRGRTYGAAAAGRIKASVRLYAEQMKRLSFTAEEVRGIVTGFLPQMMRFAPDLVEEMRGIADGADCSFEEIALVNARTEVVQIGRRRSQAAQSRDTDGCTGVIVLPEAAKDRQLIHAQNWDWRPECVDSSIMLRIQRDDGPSILTFTEAGGLARSGLNSVGMAITANYLESDRDFREPGIPLPLIRRRYLESPHFAEGIETVATTPKSGSNNMMLSLAAGLAIDFECAPDEAFALYPQDGLIAHANHWSSVAALAKLRDTGIPGVPDSFYRDYRVRQLLAPKAGQIAVEDVKAALF